MKAVDTPAQDTKGVSGKESLEARKAHPAKEPANENEFTRLRNELSQRRLDLPWAKVVKSNVNDGSKENETLADVFDGLSQSIVQHFISGPGSEEGCPSPSSCPIILMAPLFI